MTQPSRPRLRVEPLEARDVPSAPVTEPFDSATPPALPSGWGSWSNNGTTVFATSAGDGYAHSGGLLSNGNSRTWGLAWYGQQVSGDTGAAAFVKADSLVPSFVFARGTNLGTSAPNYLAAVVTRGLKVELWEVSGGSVRVLGSVTSPPTAYLSGP